MAKLDVRLEVVVLDLNPSALRASFQVEVSLNVVFHRALQRVLLALVPFQRLGTGVGLLALVAGCNVAAVGNVQDVIVGTVSVDCVAVYYVTSQDGSVVLLLF